METRIINSSLTEVYSGGGKWLTQSFPTCNREWHKRVLLTPGQNASLWREADDSEKAAWERNPPVPVDSSNPEHAAVIRRWLNAWNCCLHNAATGYLELKIPYEDWTIVIPDITLDEAVRALDNRGTGGDWCGLCAFATRFNLPPRNYPNATVTGSALFCSYNGTIELCCAVGSSTAYVNGVTKLADFGQHCGKLRAVVGRLGCTGMTDKNAELPDAPKLEEIRIMPNNPNLTSLRIPDSPLLSLASLAFMVTRRPDGSKPLAVTVHPEVYAKLTDPGNAEWNALVAQAADKQITFTIPAQE